MGVSCSKKATTQDDALLAAIRDGDDTIVRQVGTRLPSMGLPTVSKAPSEVWLTILLCRIW